VPVRAVAHAPSRDECSFDTASRIVGHHDTLGLAPIGANLQPVAGMDEELSVADAIRSYFQPPASVSVPFWARVFAPHQEVTQPTTTKIPGHGLSDFFFLKLRADGHLAERNIDVNTASTELNRSILEAIQRADSAGAFAPPSRRLRGQGGVVRLRIMDMATTTVPAVPLFIASVDAVRADAGAEQIEPPHVSYPQTGRRAAISDTVEMQYVVTAEGRAAPNSFRLTRVHYRDFAEAVIAALPSSRYQPARVGNCPVPILVEQSFIFGIRR